jgi:hypothetical protein
VAFAGTVSRLATRENDAALWMDVGVVSVATALVGVGGNRATEGVLAELAAGVLLTREHSDRDASLQDLDVLE